MNLLFFRLLCGFTAFLILFSTSQASATPDERGAFLRCVSEEGSEFPTNVFFFGESTTTHLRSRSCVTSSRVWANESGTMRLDASLPKRFVIDPASGESVSVVTLAERTRPPILVLSFGLNGISDFSRDPELYLRNYQSLLNAIHEVSPEPRFLVQSVYPVARMERQANWLFSVSPQEINRSIASLNQTLEEACASRFHADFVDTASVLRDTDGYLKETWTTDGIHLTTEAYNAILSHLRCCLHSE